MFIDSNLIPIVALGVGFVIAITSILANTIMKYKLKAEQIKADALVRAEEVRSRNQLELEKLMRQDYETVSAGSTVDSMESDRDFTEIPKPKSRVRE